MLRCFPRGMKIPGGDADIKFILAMIPHDDDVTATEKAHLDFVNQAKAVVGGVLPVDLILLIADYGCNDFVYGDEGPATRNVHLRLANSDPSQTIWGSGVHSLAQPMTGKICAVSQVEEPGSGFLHDDTIEIHVIIDPEGSNAQSLTPFDNWVIGLGAGLLRTPLFRPIEVMRLLVQSWTFVLPGTPNLLDVCRQHPEVLFGESTANNSKFLVGQLANFVLRGVSDSLGIPGVLSGPLTTGLALLAMNPFDAWCTVAPFKILAPTQTFPSIMIPHGLPVALFTTVVIYRSAFVALYKLGQRLRVQNWRWGSLLWTQLVGVTVAVLIYPMLTIRCHQQLLGCSATESFRAISAQGASCFYRGLAFHVARTLVGSLIVAVDNLEPVCHALKAASFRKRRRRFHPKALPVLLGVLSAASFIVPALLTFGLAARSKRHARVR